MKKKNVGAVVAAVFFIVFLLYMLISGVLELTNTKDVKTVNADAGAEILVIEHSINGIIPTGKDHYYVVIDGSSGEAYVVMASKNWGNENFGNDLTAKDKNGCKVTGLVKKVDYKVERELASECAALDADYPLGVRNYIDVNYKKTAVLKLILFALSILLTVTFILFVKKNGNVKSKAAVVWVVFLFVWLVLLITAIR